MVNYLNIFRLKQPITTNQQIFKNLLKNIDGKNHILILQE